MTDNTEKTEQHQTTIPVNTARHEILLSAACKEVATGAIDLCGQALFKSKDYILNDPLNAEKYIHLAEQLSLIIIRLYDLGERARTNTTEETA